MSARPLTSVKAHSQSSGSLSADPDSENFSKLSLWLVLMLSKAKDLSTAVVTKALEEYGRLDGQAAPVVIRLEFIISQVPTPSEYHCSWHSVQAICSALLVIFVQTGPR